MSLNRDAGTLATLLGSPAPLPKRRGAPPVKLSDEQVLEARRLHATGRWSAKQLLHHFGQVITDGAHGWMLSVLRYELRSSPSKPLDPRLLLRSR